jgi:hypothetical protein
MGSRTDAGFLLPGVDPDAAGFRMAYDDAQHWIVVDTSDGQLLINRTVESSSNGFARPRTIRYS